MFGIMRRLFPAAQVVQPVPVSIIKISEPTLDELLQKARDTLALDDIKLFLDAASREDKPVILELQFKDKDDSWIYVLAGEVKTTITHLGNLVVKFKDYTEGDKELARHALRAIAGESSRKFNPVHGLFFYNDVDLAISSDGIRAYKVTQLHLQTDVISKITKGSVDLTKI